MVRLRIKLSWWIFSTCKHLTVDNSFARNVEIISWIFGVWSLNVILILSFLLSTIFSDKSIDSIKFGKKKISSVVDLNLSKFLDWSWLRKLYPQLDTRLVKRKINWKSSNKVNWGSHKVFFLKIKFWIDEHLKKELLLLTNLKNPCGFKSYLVECIRCITQIHQISGVGPL